MGAISEEMAARRLPLPNFGQNRADLFGRRYRATQTALEQFGEMLRAAPSGISQPSVSLVLVEPMLWTRFELSPQGIQTSVHVSGAKRGELVLVSGEAVIGEIAARRLTIGQATERGLMRFYGPAPQIAQFLLDQEDVGANAGVNKTSSDTALPLDGAAAGSIGSVAMQSNRPDSGLPAEVACTPDHTRILIHEGGKL